MYEVMQSATPDARARTSEDDVAYLISSAISEDTAGKRLGA